MSDGGGRASVGIPRQLKPQRTIHVVERPACCFVNSPRSIRQFISFRAWPTSLPLADHSSATLRAHVTVSDAQQISQLLVESVFQLHHAPGWTLEIPWLRNPSNAPPFRNQRCLIRFPNTSKRYGFIPMVSFPWFYFVVREADFVHPQSPAP